MEGRPFFCSRASETAAALKAGDEVELFFRPDDTMLVTEEGDNTLEAQVAYANYQGNTTQYALDIGDTALRAIVPGRPHFGSTGKTRIRINPDKLIVEKS